MVPGPLQEHPPNRAKRGVLERFQYLWVGLGVLVFFSLGWRGRLPVMIVGGDELTYVSISRSLEAGTYREVYTASAPRHVKYPPGYPAWLMVVRKLGGESHDLVRALNLAFVAAAIVGAYLIVRKVAGVGAALAAMTVLAINPPLLDVGATLLSEAPFLGLTGAALAATALASPSSSKGAHLAVVLAMAAFLTRAAGLTLVVAVGLWLLGRRRRPELAVYAVACLVVVGGWFAYTRLVPADTAGQSYRTDFSGVDSGWSPEAPSRLDLAYQHGVGYATDGLPSVLALPTIPGTKVDNALWLAGLIALIGAGIVKLSRVSRASAWYLVLSGALLLAWPWRQDRLLLPLIPFVMAAILIGADSLTRSRDSRTRTLLLGSLTLLMCLGAVRGAAARDAKGQACDRSHPYESPGCYDTESRTMVAASHFLRSTAPAGAVVLTVSGAAVNYLSGLPTEPIQVVREFPRGKTGEGLRNRGVRYILITGGRSAEKEWLGQILLASCHGLRLEARFPPAGFVLTTDPPQGPSEDACGPLTELVNSAEDRPGSVPEPETQ